jgi:hypothetical protein
LKIKIRQIQGKTVTGKETSFGKEMVFFPFFHPIFEACQAKNVL